LQVSLHLTCIKDEVARAWPPSCLQESETSSDTPPPGPHPQLKFVTSPFVSEEVLDVIGSVLRPEDGAPDLPAQIDPVSFPFCIPVSKCCRPWWIWH